MYPRIFSGPRKISGTLSYARGMFRYAQHTNRVCRWLTPSLLRREHGTGARVIANDVSASGVNKNASHWERSCAAPSFQSHPSTASHYPYVAHFASVANFGCESHFECVGRIACAVIDPCGPDWRASQIPGSSRPVWEHQRWCLVVSWQPAGHG